MIWLPACEAPGGSLADDDDDDTPPADDLTWERCPLVPGQDDDQAECATTALPLDHGDPDGEQIDVLIKRYPSRGAETGQVWLMHGGPGASAVDDLLGLAHGLSDERTDLGWYAIDHRGIGGTARLDCPEQEAPDSPGGVAVYDTEMPDCLVSLEQEWGAGLD